MVCATSKASDQPAHTRRLIRTLVSRLSLTRRFEECYWVCEKSINIMKIILPVIFSIIYDARHKLYFFWPALLISKRTVYHYLLQITFANGFDPDQVSITRRTWSISRPVHERIAWWWLAWKCSRRHIKLERAVDGRHLKSPCYSFDPPAPPSPTPGAWSWQQNENSVQYVLFLLFVRTHAKFGIKMKLTW